MSKAPFAPVVPRAESSHPFLSGAFAPIDRELDLSNVIVKGTIPRELNGVFLRVGPNPRWPPAHDYHWFEGTGMVHGFTLRDGQVAYKNRWLRTSSYLAEERAGHSLVSRWGDASLIEPGGEPIVWNTANTSILSFGGRTFALEEFNPPFAFEAETLNSDGPYTFGGRLTGPMSAHVKIDPRSRDLIAYGYQANGPGGSDVWWAIVSPDGVVKREGVVHGPFCSFMHDFIVTETHMVFPFYPLSLSLDRVRKGQSLIAWEPELESHFAIVPRNGGAVRWLKADAMYAFHVLNGFDDGAQKIVADVHLMTNGVFNFPEAGTGATGHGTPPRLARMTFDMTPGRERVTTAYTDELPSDFPRVDPRFAMRRHRIGYMGTVMDPTVTGPGFTGVARFDNDRGTKVGWSFGEGASASEPVFVPRHPDAPEGDGWLLTVVYRTELERSELAVFDTAEMDRGPMGVAALPHRVPLGFHGEFVPDRAS